MEQIMKNQHNIILIDRSLDYIEYILTNTKWEIACLVIEKKDSKAIFANHQRIKKIVYYDDLFCIHQQNNIDLNIIEKMRDIQLDCETTMHRCFHDNTLAKYFYYSHLSFFLKIFQSTQLDFILCTETNLGVPSVTIPLGLAKLYNIPAYTIDPDSAFNTLYKYNQEKYIRSIKNFHISIEKKMYAHYDFSKKIKYSFLKEFFYNSLNKIGGQLLVEFFVCIFHFNFCYYERLGVHFNFWSKLRSYLNFKKAMYFYNKNSITPNLKEKFIYFSLHVEPEAVILARVGLDNQLLLIKMLSDAIPKDWYIYVKEHPHQNKINNRECSYMINNIDYFKSKNFYKEIAKLNNVKLISIQTSSKELMLNSQAVASIGGSISIEAWKNHKMAINFCPKQTFSSFLGNSLGVENSNDLQKAIETIINQRSNMYCCEKDIVKMETYLFPKDKQEIPIVLNTILEDIKENSCK